jgi:hypothetical protein
MLKKLASKAADESKPEAYPQGYVEDFDEPRTKLAGFFSILLGVDWFRGNSQIFNRNPLENVEHRHDMFVLYT